MNKFNLDSFIGIEMTSVVTILLRRPNIRKHNFLSDIFQNSKEHIGCYNIPDNFDEIQLDQNKRKINLFSC